MCQEKKEEEDSLVLLIVEMYQYRDFWIILNKAKKYYFLQPITAQAW